MIRLIGFCGPIGSGKTTAARVLERVCGFERMRFAEPLKAMLRTLGLDESQVDGDRKETPSALLCGRTPREAMQTLGTEWGRDLIGEDLWVHAWAWRADEALVAGRSVVVDDVRNVNEARAIWARGGKLIGLERPGVMPGGHVSERFDLSLADARIRNDGDAVALERKVAAALLEIG